MSSVASSHIGVVRSRRALVLTAAAWCAALIYPALLTLAVLHEPELTGVRLVPSALLAALVVPLLLRRPLPALLLLLLASFAATMLARDQAAWPFASRQAWQVTYLQALYTDLVVGFIAATRSRREAVAAGVLALATQVAAVPYHRSGSDNTVSTILTLVLALATAWLIGYSLAERSKHARMLREQAAARAVTAERLRIARELHDMVAHSIGIIAIQAGVGRRVIETQPDEARKALGAIETTSRETLAGLRRMLGALRRSEPEPQEAPLDPAPGLADLDALVSATRDAGVRVTVHVLGPRRPLPPEVDLAAYRIVQESLTNVVRHAGVNECAVTVDFRPEEVVLGITDEGRRGSDRPVTGAGYGIPGMRERTALLRGTFTAAPLSGGGFQVRASLPVPDEVAPVMEQP
ncbi:sensor histidine kinase [Streptomyces sp. KLOTTS4A1]|uniref:sensor histidine kinase n=1 Tax=Streptomyces sp. KLOTTS4A1 TaxID=3390996 RepID=UPI0039F4D633